MGKAFVQRKAPHNKTTSRWRDHLNHVEEQRVKVLEDRLGRAAVTATENYKEKGKIMNTAIRRMRRAEGKQ
jgi:hypothetical protein